MPSEYQIMNEFALEAFRFVCENSKGSILVSDTEFSQNIKEVINGNIFSYKFAVVPKLGIEFFIASVRDNNYHTFINAHVLDICVVARNIETGKIIKFECIDRVTCEGYCRYVLYGIFPFKYFLP